MLARIAAAALVVAGLGLGAEAATRKAAPAKAATRDWTKFVAATLDGGFRIGNPAAKVRLVEYGSVWCSHCKHFHEEGVPALKARYISTGKVSYEIRNFVLNPPDLAATLVVQCGGLPAYFKTLDAFYARQREWQGNYFKLSPDDLAKIDAVPEERRALAFARAMQLDAFAKPLGLSPAKAEQCLLSKSAFDRLIASNNKAVGLGLKFTPTFLINDALVPEASSWEALEPALRAAL